MVKSGNGRNSKTSRGKRRADRSWCSDRVLKLFSDASIEDFFEDALEHIRSRRVLDFFIMPGCVSAKVQDDTERSEQIRISFEALSEEQWNSIFDLLAAEALYLADILSGNLPVEIESAFREIGVNLFPSSLDELHISIQSERVTSMTTHLAAVIYKLCETLDDDPLSIFVLRGKGRDESILEIRKRRMALRKQQVSQSTFSYQQVSYEPAPPLITTIDHFWSSSPSLSEISYSIRADELPASVLKRLDLLPLGGLEDEVDFLLEQAYVQIATRAQAFGLGLK